MQRYIIILKIYIIQVILLLYDLPKLKNTFCIYFSGVHKKLYFDRLMYLNCIYDTYFNNL